MFSYTSRMAASAALILLCASPLLSQTTLTVDVQDNSFDPEDITICVGDSIVWDWTGNNPHSSTSGDNCDSDNAALIWDSGDRQNPGAADFSRLFGSVPADCAEDDSVGDNSCSYFCDIHCSAMLGTVTIQENPTSDLSLGTNKLRVSKNSGDGSGTTKGVQTLNQFNPEDIDKSSRTVTVIVDSGGVVEMDLVSAPNSRQTFSNSGSAVSIGTVVLRETSSGEIKTTVKYKTNGMDLSGPVTVSVLIEHGVTGGCGGVAVAEDTGPAQK